MLAKSSGDKENVFPCLLPNKNKHGKSMKDKELKHPKKMHVEFLFTFLWGMASRLD